jgi:uncharacterized RDD family membrane protein YckC
MEVWIGRDGERHGPYTDGDIRQWLRSGQVSRDDLGWYEGLADWQPLSMLFPDDVRNSVPPAFSTSPAAPLPSTTILALEDYSGFWKRFAAWVIDYLILLIPMSIIALNMGATAAFEHLITALQSGTAATTAAAEYVASARPATLIALVVGYIYYVIFECSKWQATPGKLALGLRVTDLEGGRLSLGRSLVRNAVRLVNALSALIPLICYLAVAWTPRKQGFHDMIAKTLVLNGSAAKVKPVSISSSDNNNSFSA